MSIDQKALEDAAVKWANARGTLDVFVAEHGREDRITVEAAAAEHAASIVLRDEIGKIIIERFKK